MARSSDEEEDSLIERSREDKRSFFGKRALIICCIVCVVKLLVILAIAAIFATKHKRKSQHNKNCTSSLNGTKSGLPKNISDFSKENENLCKLVANMSGSSERNNPANIYIIKTKPNLTDREACGIESILRLFPDKTVFLVDFIKPKKEDLTHEKCNTPPNYLGLLLFLYKNRLEVTFADRETFFKNTPLSNVSKTGDNFEFLAMLLTAYKYGGFVVTPDVVMNSRDLVECLPEETIIEPYTILSSKKCDTFLHYMMKSFSVCGPKFQCSMEDVLTKSVELYARTAHPGEAARRLVHPEFCTKPQDTCTFLKLKEFQEGDTKGICELSPFCKQVVQQFLGLKLNQIEVEEETSKIKLHLASHKKTCKHRTNGGPNSGDTCKINL